MRRRDFVSLLAGISTASIVLPRRMIFVPPRLAMSTMTMFEPLPFRQPDPALFEMLEDMRKAAEDLCAVSETYWRGQDGRFYVQSRLHNADEPVRVLSTYQWPRLELPFV
jgi:hypothetical protein